MRNENGQDDDNYVDSKFAEALRDREHPSDDQLLLLSLYIANGVIENGGLVFFFEKDFEGGVTHAQIASMYEQIGMSELARLLRKAFSVFPSGRPQEDLFKRDEVLSSQKVSDYFEELGPYLFKETARFTPLIAEYLRGRPGE